QTPHPNVSRSRGKPNGPIRGRGPARLFDNSGSTPSGDTRHREDPDDERPATAAEGRDRAVRAALADRTVLQRIEVDVGLSSVPLPKLCRGGIVGQPGVDRVFVSGVASSQTTRASETKPEGTDVVEPPTNSRPLPSRSSGQ